MDCRIVSFTRSILIFREYHQEVRMLAAADAHQGRHHALFHGKNKR